MPTCLYPGCDRPAIVRGHCVRCQNRLRRRGSWDAVAMPHKQPHQRVYNRAALDDDGDPPQAEQERVRAAIARSKAEKRRRAEHGRPDFDGSGGGFGVRYLFGEPVPASPLWEPRGRVVTDWRGAAAG